MRFLILGAGALGGFFGAKLVHSGADVTFLVRPKRAAQLQRDGLVVKSQDWEIRTNVKTIAQGQIDAPFDVILLSCKAYDLEGAMDAIAPAVGASSAILPMLTGMCHIDRLKQRGIAGGDHRRNGHRIRSGVRRGGAACARRDREADHRQRTGPQSRAVRLAADRGLALPAARLCERP